jgi:polynucleotide 5'-kinase involved in rRNA processing
VWLFTVVDVCLYVAPLSEGAETTTKPVMGAPHAKWEKAQSNSIMDHPDDASIRTGNGEDIEESPPLPPVLMKEDPAPVASKSRKRAHPDAAVVSPKKHDSSEQTSAAAFSVLTRQPGTTVTWENGGMDAIITFPSLELSNYSSCGNHTYGGETGYNTTNNGRDSLVHCCLVGRARLTCWGEGGGLEVMGYQLGTRTGRTNSNPVDKLQHVDVVSAPWSSFITIQQKTTSTTSTTTTSTFAPTYLKVASLRPPPMNHSVKQQHEPETVIHPTFQLLDPMDPMARPTIFPPSWIRAVDQIVDEWSSSSHRLVRPGEEPPDGSSKIIYTTPPPPLPPKYKKGASTIHHHHRHHRHRARVAICGAKGVGKSTCLRYMANRLLSSGQFDKGVAILDADVGQPELSPPGLLTLSILHRPLLHPPHVNNFAMETTRWLDPTSFSLPEDIPLEHGGSSTATPIATTTATSNPLLLSSSSSSPDTTTTTTTTTPTDTTIISCVFFGAITHKVDPTRYMEGIHYLIRQYEQRVTPNGNECRIPLLINMDGWIKGLGYEVMSALLSNTAALRPSHILQLVGETRAKMFDLQEMIGSGSGGTDPLPILHVIDAFHNHHSNLSMVAAGAEAAATTTATTKTSTSRWMKGASSWPNDPATEDGSHDLPISSPKDYYGPTSTGTTGALTVAPGTIPAASLRTIRLGSYFVPDVDLWDRLLLEQLDDRLHQGWMDDECAIAHILAAERPYCVPFESVHFYLIGTDRQDVCSEDMILRALNASIVGLCCSSSTTTNNNNELATVGAGPNTRNDDTEGDDVQDETQDDAPVPHVRDDVCLGLGLIRSIDLQHRLFYILTPVSPTLLPKVTSLVGGSIETPLQFLFRGCHAESFPYLTIRDHNHNYNRTKPLGSDPMQSRNNIARKSINNNSNG